MKNVSILIPSRDRPQLLKRLLESIEAKTFDLAGIEILLTVDEDDPQLQKYGKIADGVKFCDFSINVVERDPCFPAYYNGMAEIANGNMLWVLNDDCLIQTAGWDARVTYRAQEFKDNHKHNIWYGDIGDTTRNYNNNGQYSCFPMMSREAFHTLGYFFNPKIIAWGTDKYLKHVFTQAKAGIIDLTDIMVEHAHLQDDETHKVLINRLRSYAGQECTVDYSPEIERMKRACQ
jgi:hypothetical protein